MTLAPSRSATLRIRVAWILVGVAIASIVLASVVSQALFSVYYAQVVTLQTFASIAAVNGLLFGSLVPLIAMVAAASVLPVPAVRRVVGAVVLGLLMLLPATVSVFATLGAGRALLVIGGVLGIARAVGAVFTWLWLRERAGRTYWVPVIPLVVLLATGLAQSVLQTPAAVGVVLQVAVVLVEAASVVGAAWLAAALDRPRPAAA